MFRAIILAALIFTLALGASAQVMMNEFFYDTQSTDDPTIMFVEIYGPGGTDLTGWSLVGINGNGGTDYLTVPLSGSIPTDGYFVVGGSAVANVDQVVTAYFQNAGSQSGDDCDGIDLRNGSTTVDHLCYGICASGHVCNGEGGSNAPDPFPSTASPNSHLARIPDHVDSDSNSVNWIISDELTPGAINSGEPCDPTYALLVDVRENDENGVPAMLDQFVVTRGIVNVDNMVFDTLSRFYFQDDEAGALVLWGTVPTNIVAGDCVVVSGWIGQYNGLTEFESSGTGNCQFDVERVDHVEAPSPTLITSQSDLESYEGMLVRINDVQITDGTWPATGQYGNLTVTDGSGQIGLNIIKWTDIPGSEEPAEPFSVIGILGQHDTQSPYTSGYQIQPRSLADILPAAADDPQAAPLAQEFKLAGAYPNPFNPSTTIRYEVGSARTIVLSIFDVLGREVTHQMLTGLTPGAHSYTWTPTGAAGLYFVQMKGASLTQTAKLLFVK
jgi:hypothetical protein